MPHLYLIVRTDVSHLRFLFCFVFFVVFQTNQCALNLRSKHGPLL